MLRLDLVSVGITFTIAAVVLIGITYLLLRVVPRLRPGRSSPAIPQYALDLDQTDQAVLVVQSGGRVIHINDLGREWFRIGSDEPNIERLARRTRPSEAFLALCASEGATRFSLDGRLMEGTSYYLPPHNQTPGACLVSLKRSQLVANAADGLRSSGQVFEEIAELSRNMASSLELDTTLHAILESVDRLIPSDLLEITVWDRDTQQATPYYLSESSDGTQQLHKASRRYEAGKGYPGYLIKNKRPLLVGNVETFVETRPMVEAGQTPYKSYLGMPLLVAGELVGTLELASLGTDSFGDPDLVILRMLGSQAAVALNNALLFQEDQRRIVELSGLAKLTQASGTFQDSQDFYTHLVESISPLFSVKTLGFLIYDDSQRKLRAQLPFHGLPPDFVAWYEVVISPDSLAEEIWESQEMLLAPQAAQDVRLEVLGLAHFALAAGIQSTILMPLISAGRMLGYLQVADREDGLPFSEDNLHLLTIVAGQAATIIENAILFRQSQERIRRSEALRRIASLTGSMATLNEILSFSLRELAHLLNADVAAICLVNEDRAEFTLHKDSLFGVQVEQVGRLARISMDDTAYRQTATARQHSIYIDEITPESEIPSIYQPLLSANNLKSVMIAPLIVRERGAGEIILASRTAGFLERFDLSVISTTASQLASAIEKSTLYSQTDDSLRRHVDQLLALTRVSRELNARLDLEPLMELILDELLHTTRANCGNIWLFELTEQPQDSPRIMMTVGDAKEKHLIPVEIKALTHIEGLIIADYAEPVPELGRIVFEPPHDEVRSSLLVPIIYQEAIAGLIHLHARPLGFFDETSMDTAQSLATQAAIALGNAMRFNEQIQRTELLNRRVTTLSKLMEANKDLFVGQPLEAALESIAFAIQESTPFNEILISVFDPAQQALVRVAGAGIPLDSLSELRQTTQSWAGVMQDCTEEFRFNLSYMIPFERRRIHPADIHLHVVETTIGWAADRILTEHAWHPQDMLLVPLIDKAGNPLGLISADNPRNGLRPDLQTIESLEVFASQAALTIESHNQLKEIRQRAAELTDDLLASRQALNDSQTHLPLLLHKDVEQTLAIQGLSLRNQRLQAGLGIVQEVNQQTNRLDVLKTLGSELLVRLDMDLVLLAERGPGGPRMLGVLGSELPAGINLEALLGQKNPIRSSLQSGELILVSQVDKDAEWQGLPFLQALSAQAFICLPVMVKDSVDSVLLAVKHTPLSSLAAEDTHFYRMVCNQVSVALENLRLLDETNRRLQEVNLLLDFSRQLAHMDAVSILQTLVSSSLKVVPAADSGMVALWDAEQEVLVPQAASGYVDNRLIMQITYRIGQALPGLAYEKGEVLRIGEVEFSRDYNLAAENLLLYRDGNAGRLPVSTLIIPIQAGDHKLGVLVLDNFRTSNAFKAEDQDLVSALVRQTALLLENLRLVQAAEQRASQLLALTNVSTTITSSLQTNELIASLLDQVKAVIPYDTAILWLRQGNQLTVRAAAGFDDSDQRIGLVVAVEDSILLKEMIATRGPISVGNVREDERFPSLVEYERLSWLGVPLLSKGEVVGVIVVEKTEANFYTPDHIALIVTFAGQAAVSLVNAGLYEESVSRALELDKRSQRLALLNRLSTQLSSSLDQDEVFRVASRELSQAIHCSSISCVQVEADSKLLVRVETLQGLPAYPFELPDNPLFGWMRDSLGIFMTANVAQEEMLLPLLAFLSTHQTHSLMVVPLVSANALLGMFMIHVDHPYHFEDDELELARTIGNQTSVALQNARLFAETEALVAETHQRSTELAALFEMGVNVSQVLDIEHLVEATFENILRMINANGVGLVLLGEGDTLVLRALDRGEWVGPAIAPRQGTSFSEYVLTTSKPLLIYDIEQEAPNLPVQGLTIGERVKSWLGAPLLVRGAPVGVISVQSYHPNAFTEDHLRLLVQVANQLSVAFDNARLFETVQSYAADLEVRVSERTRELEREHDRLQTLLGIITELSTSLDLDLVLNNTLAIINRTLGAGHSLIMLLKIDQPELYQRVSLGYATSPDRKGVTQPLMRDEGLANWVIMNRLPALIGDLREDPRWIQHAGRPSEHRSSIAVPLMMGDDNLGVMILYHRQPNYFTQDQFELVQATARQISVAINNARLYNLIRDQAERLGDMLRTQHVETSRSQAILEAVADGVLVTDARGMITLYNASAEHLLGLSRSDVLGQGLEHFIGLFGDAGQTWVQTIQKWSDDPSIYSPGESYTVQIELDNRRVVAVHLSPVLLRNDFLGTVSIFRDITHLIEVDRLKSEFVATVSHELRTPMTSIKGYVEILLMGAAGKLTEQQNHFLQVVRSNTERLAILVNDLLDISRIEAGKVTLSLQPLDLYKITRTAVATITQRMMDERRPLHVELDLAQNLPAGYGDPERIQQILDNLVENAYQYTPEDGHIWIRVFQAGEELQVDVQDDGIGIAPKDQMRIFERFYRGEDPLVLGTPGTGLGLSIVKHLVEMHHGRIWFRSEGIIGKGSVFSFTLPIYKSDVEKPGT